MAAKSILKNEQVGPFVVELSTLGDQAGEVRFHSGLDDFGWHVGSGPLAASCLPMLYGLLPLQVPPQFNWDYRVAYLVAVDSHKDTLQNY